MSIILLFEYAITSLVSFKECRVANMGMNYAIAGGYRIEVKFPLTWQFRL